MAVAAVIAVVGDGGAIIARAPHALVTADCAYPSPEHPTPCNCGLRLPLPDTLPMERESSVESTPRVRMCDPLCVIVFPSTL